MVWVTGKLLLVLDINGILGSESHAFVSLLYVMAALRAFLKG
jgi:hypothetical protein